MATSAHLRLAHPVLLASALAAALAACTAPTWDVTDAGKTGNEGQDDAAIAPDSKRETGDAQMPAPGPDGAEPDAAMGRGSAPPPPSVVVQVPPENRLDGSVPNGVDPCTRCDPKASCNRAASQACTCPSTLSDARGDGSQCVDPCAQAACDAHASCTVVKGAALCECKLPYLGDGKTCRFDDECSTLKCGASEKCAVQGETISCECKDGYGKLASACVNVNECLSELACTRPNQVCTDTEGSFTCSCRPAPDLLAGGTFEEQGSTLGSPWSRGPDGMVTINGTAHGGQKSVKISVDAGWTDIAQNVMVTPGSRYRLSAWVQTSDNGSTGWLGARSPADVSVGVGAVNFAPSGGYTQVSTEIVPGSLSTIQIFLGIWATTGTTWVSVDDLSLQRLSSDGSCP